jgi:CheY-like chemotaxis protein
VETPLRVLVVENHPATRELLSTLLAEAGVSVTAVGDGRAALLQMAHDRPHVVVTDLRMPLLDGNGLAAAIRADVSLRDVAIVVVTAHPEYAEGDFDALVSKPFDTDDFLATIRQVANRRTG